MDTQLLFWLVFVPTRLTPNEVAFGTGILTASAPPAQSSCGPFGENSEKSW